MVPCCLDALCCACRGFPLVLPVKHVYDHMVESYSGEFSAGDAVQIKDGIVHAGPGCTDEPGKPRVVIFMTYRSRATEKVANIWFHLLGGLET